MEKNKLVAICLFGTEGIVADELKRMGAEGVTAENGIQESKYGVCFRFFTIKIQFVSLFKFRANGINITCWHAINFMGRNNKFRVKKFIYNSINLKE